jgi:hypothetical protein
VNHKTPWRRVKATQFVHRKSGVIVNVYDDGRVWIEAGGCDKKSELRDLAELLMFLATEP